MDTTGTMEERVERGAKLLDEHVEGWADEVQGAILDGLFDMSNWDSCVVGQLELQLRSQGVGPEIYFNGTKVGRWVDASDHGFTLGDDMRGGRDEWDALEWLWVERVRERTGEAAAAEGGEN
jgi:hypothetical protein